MKAFKGANPRLRAPSKALLLSYGGLGDGVLMAPLARGLAARLGSGLLIPETVALGFVEILYPEAAWSSGRAPRTWRRLYDKPPSVISAFVAEMSIDLVVSLRRDRFAYPAQFARARGTLRSAGVRLVDICDGLTVSDQERHTVSALHARLARRLGLPRSSAGPGPAPDGPVGVFPSCSVEHKQPGLPIWAAIGRGLAARRLAATVVSGVGEGDVSFAHAVANRLEQAGVTVAMKSCPISALPAMVASCRAIAAPDSFPVHLADTLGVPSFAVYLSTDPRMYGSGLAASWSATSSYYLRCPRRTVVGNCDAWERPCPDRPCAGEVDPEAVAASFSAFLEDVDAA
jgi:hypothetical protein